MAVNSLVAWRTSAPRVYLHTRDGVREPPRGRGPRYWVVAREYCRFFQVPLLEEATLRQQLDALSLQIERLSPFHQTGHHFHLGADFICLWLWDRDAVQSTAKSIGVNLDRITVLPETALRPTGADGARLVETLGGIEGQTWRNGALATSRWWPSLPDAQAWVRFQRGASLPADQVTTMVPEPLQLGWLDRPWTRMPTPGASRLAGIDLRYAAAAAAALIIAAYGYFSAEWLRLALDTEADRAESAALLHGAEPIIGARATALTNLAAIDRLRKLDRYPGQIALMARVAEVLPHNDNHFTDWLFDRGQLQVTIAADHRLDAVYFVKSLEAVRGFKDVSAERANNDNTLRIRLKVDPS